ncbi:hypothetical protein EMIHUDRAFT_213749 [Emiliania huxleyi CCMP1516]|uniref:Alpha/beta hydrolase n=2 Tax=Emiliania huxleyi TaxID=2903 RepID=A0A0D3IMH8_EMIH1|nr:hypothetical protein EMIHUDRAFT_213749 [Emiliania huxleyi CCMP1516]EOD12463.1 hypothetical protein EMIHUDRAFT_213749 [Emiliania huxleyi CCMP1516]|eukprot:XP_005764892.1 hypothetical protein EMIHUDRAFT_213749 [Emiliania huxleyi CCMP1516]
MSLFRGCGTTSLYIPPRTGRGGTPPRTQGLALLLGWTAGSYRHVQKHARLWHGLGMRTATATTDLAMTFQPARLTGIEWVADNLLHTVRSQPEDSLIVPHVFSNGGALLLLTLLKRAREAGCPLSFDATVYDSAPSRSLWPAQAPLVGWLSTSGLPLRERLALLGRVSANALAAQALAPIKGVEPPLGDFPQLSDPAVNAPRPELFMYSGADSLVPARGIEAFAQRRAEVGCDVQLRRFEGSPHCEHYRRHPGVYDAAVRSFVGSLAGWKDEAQPTERDRDLGAQAPCDISA